MNKQRSEEFRPNEKGTVVLQDLEFVLANDSHIDGVFGLMYFRNPGIDKEELRNKVRREIQEYSDGKEYGLFVAKSEGKVVGFCRFFLSKDVPKEKVKFEHPKGLYCMGIMVDPNYRRRGVAKFLSDKRFEWIKGLGVNEVYSMVAADNPTSINMHQNFGYHEVLRGPGFLNVTFDCGEGILFKKVLD